MCTDTDLPRGPGIVITMPLVITEQETSPAMNETTPICAKSIAAPVAKRSIPWMFDLNGAKLETDLIFFHFSEA